MFVHFLACLSVDLVDPIYAPIHYFVPDSAAGPTTDPIADI